MYQSLFINVLYLQYRFNPYVYPIYLTYLIQYTCSPRNYSDADVYIPVLGIIMYVSIPLGTRCLVSLRVYVRSSIVAQLTSRYRRLGLGGKENIATTIRAETSEYTLYRPYICIQMYNVMYTYILPLQIDTFSQQTRRLIQVLQLRIRILISTFLYPIYIRLSSIPICNVVSVPTQYQLTLHISYIEIRLYTGTLPRDYNKNDKLQSIQSKTQLGTAFSVFATSENLVRRTAIGTIYCFFPLRAGRPISLVRSPILNIRRLVI